MCKGGRIVPYGVITRISEPWVWEHMHLETGR
jgi:hypothetical protein